MHHWSNTAQAPSRLDERKDRALQYVMDKLDIPDCGLKVVRNGIDNPTRFAMHVSHDGAHAGMWEFHPVMGMSFNKNGIDYTQTTITAKGVEAKGKYIPVQCEGQTAHVVYFPKCGNIATLVKKEKEYVVKKEKVVEEKEVIIYRDKPYIEYENCHKVPIPSTLLLVVLGLVTIWRFKK